MRGTIPFGRAHPEHLNPIHTAYHGLLFRIFLQAGSTCCSYFNSTFGTEVEGNWSLGVSPTVFALLLQDYNLTIHAQDSRRYHDVLKGQKFCVRMEI